MPAMQIDAAGGENVLVDPVPQVEAVGPLVGGAVILAVAASLAVALRVARRIRAGRAVPDRRPHADVPWDGLDVAFVCAAYVVCATIAGAALPPGPSLVATMIAHLVAIAAAMLLAVTHLRRRGADLRALGWDGSAWRDDVRIAVGGLALVVAPLLGLATALDRLVPYRHPLVDLLLVDRGPPTLAVVVLVAVVAAPLAEEFFFRRVLQGWLESKLPPRRRVVAVAISAACFALAHVGQGLAYVPLFVLGLVLGWIAMQSGSIGACVLLHALFNAVSVGIVLVTTRPAG